MFVVILVLFILALLMMITLFILFIHLRYNDDYVYYIEKKDLDSRQLFFSRAFYISLAVVIILGVLTGFLFENI